MSDLETLLLGELRASRAKHPVRTRELTKDFIGHLRLLRDEERELEAKDYARIHDLEVRTVWQARRDGRLPATKRGGIWYFRHDAKIARRGVANATKRKRVVTAHELRPGRWSLKLECDHRVEVSSSNKPQMAKCHQCDEVVGERQP